MRMADEFLFQYVQPQRHSQSFLLCGRATHTRASDYKKNRTKMYIFIGRRQLPYDFEHLCLHYEYTDEYPNTHTHRYDAIAFICRFGIHTSAYGWFSFSFLLYRFCSFVPFVWLFGRSIRSVICVRYVCMWMSEPVSAAAAAAVKYFYYCRAVSLCTIRCVVRWHK